MEANPTRAQRWCGPKCRGAAYRLRKRGGPSLAVVRSIPLAPEDDGSVRAAVLRELTAAGQQSSAAGRAALVLADRIEAGTDPGGAVASMVRELRETLATTVVRKPKSRLAELRAEGS